MRYRPTRDEFAALAAEHDVVPVWREILGDVDTPLSVYAKLKASGDGPTFLLESAEHGLRWGRYSFVGMDPYLTMTSRGGVLTWDGTPPPAAADTTTALDALQATMRARRAPTDLDGLDIPFHGGAVGMLGYDVVREIERLPDTTEDDLGLPDVMVLFPRHVVGLDHLRQVITVVTNVIVDEDPDLDAAYERACRDCDAVIKRLDTATVARPAAPPAMVRPERVPSNMTPQRYEEMVRTVQEHILAGDTFQTVVSQRFAVETAASAFDVYRALRVINPSPYLFIFDVGEFQVVGSSPEALVQVKGDHVETWPIAGTRPRGETPAEDRAYEEELLASSKERAEHVMLVDLARNDLGRVCEIGTVQVGTMMEVERYSHVMHIVSAVTGTLRDGLDAVDVLRAVFPAGTVSGAPKVRAMEIIDELEPTRRGTYAGAIGYLDHRGNLDTCIALRTVVMHDGTAYVQAGAGIVADSDPAEEETETRNKAGAVLAAVQAAAMLHD